VEGQNNLLDKDVDIYALVENKIGVIKCGKLSMEKDKNSQKENKEWYKDLACKCLPYNSNKGSNLSKIPNDTLFLIKIIFH